jgi:hypothetical protein
MRIWLSADPATGEVLLGQAPWRPGAPPAITRVNLGRIALPKGGTVLLAAENAAAPEHHFTGRLEEPAILADTLEAVLGAAYLGHGIDEASALVHRLVGPLIEASAHLGAGLDWKTSLQELTATVGLGVPEYAITEEGPDHAKLFHASAIVAGESYGTGHGSSKKEAEQQAAETAWKTIRERFEVPVESTPLDDGAEVSGVHPEPHDA